jgi:hypothetical protein
MNLQESYPCVVPMWFTEAEETSVIDSVEKISTYEHENAEKLVRNKPYAPFQTTLP